MGFVFGTEERDKNLRTALDKAMIDYYLQHPQKEFQGLYINLDGSDWPVENPYITPDLDYAPMIVVDENKILKYITDAEKVNTIIVDDGFNEYTMKELSAQLILQGLVDVEIISNRGEALSDIFMEMLDKLEIGYGGAGYDDDNEGLMDIIYDLRYRPSKYLIVCSLNDTLVDCKDLISKNGYTSHECTLIDKGKRAYNLDNVGIMLKDGTEIHGHTVDYSSYEDEEAEDDLHSYYLVLEAMKDKLVGCDVADIIYFYPSGSLWKNIIGYDDDWKDWVPSQVEKVDISEAKFNEYHAIVDEYINKQRQEAAFINKMADKLEVYPDEEPEHLYLLINNRCNSVEEAAAFIRNKIRRMSVESIRDFIGEVEKQPWANIFFETKEGFLVKEYAKWAEENEF